MSHSLLQPRAFCLGFPRDGDVRVGVSPEGEEILMSVCSSSVVARHESSTELKQFRCTRPSAELYEQRGRMDGFALDGQLIRSWPTSSTAADKKTKAPQTQ